MELLDHERVESASRKSFIEPSFRASRTVPSAFPSIYERQINPLTDALVKAARPEGYCSQALDGGHQKVSCAVSGRESGNSASTTPCLTSGSPKWDAVCLAKRIFTVSLLFGGRLGYVYLTRA
jgi:hypothetical protein